jgi:hypothetical protein
MQTEPGMFSSFIAKVVIMMQFMKRAYTETALKRTVGTKFHSYFFKLAILA